MCGDQAWHDDYEAFRGTSASGTLSVEARGRGFIHERRLNGGFGVVRMEAIDGEVFSFPRCIENFTILDFI